MVASPARASLTVHRTPLSVVSIAPAKVRALRFSLLSWFDKHQRDLPWRKTQDPYRIWLSEIMLQQTRVDAVIPYYHRFLAAFPSVFALAVAPQARVLRLWEGLGYYARARNLHRAAKVLVARCAITESQKGTQKRTVLFPQRARDWMQIPGVGRYTAGAIASIASGERTPVVDGNVKRVLARIFCLRYSIDRTDTTEHIWTTAEALVPSRRSGDFNQALMELGATTCLPRQPRCPSCPVARQCEALSAGIQEELPLRRRRRPIPHLEVVAGALSSAGRYLLCQRPPCKMLGGLWAFPGGKVETGESHAEALVRELREELGVHVTVGALIASVDHAFSHFSMTLSLYACRILSGTPEKRHYSALRWLRIAELGNYAMPVADRRLVALSGIQRTTENRPLASSCHRTP